MNRAVQNPGMARPAEFDRSQAVNDALLLFWRKGCQASSVAEVLTVMDIGRSSFYAAFADKRSLYIECLELIAARTQELLQRARSEMPPVMRCRGFSNAPSSVAAAPVLPTARPAVLTRHPCSNNWRNKQSPRPNGIFTNTSSAATAKTSRASAA